MFLLYIIHADEDPDFVKIMLEKLEDEYGLKVSPLVQMIKTYMIIIAIYHIYMILIIE